MTVIPRKSVAPEGSIQPLSESGRRACEYTVAMEISSIERQSKHRCLMDMCLEGKQGAVAADEAIGAKAAPTSEGRWRRSNQLGDYTTSRRRDLLSHACERVDANAIIWL
jgi:hypothetical protein